MSAPRRAFYRAVGHHLVDGWIEPPVLSLVAALTTDQHARGITGAVAEIGVHHGRLLLGMHLARAAGESSLAVDVFGDQSLNVDASGLGDEARLRRNLRRYGGGERDVRILRADSTTLDGADVRAAVGGVRLFDVDGGHTPDIVAHDLATAAASLVDGGVILSDDVFNEQWPGVQEGTVRFTTAQDDVVAFGIGFNKTMFAAAEHAEHYRQVLRDAARTYHWDVKETVMQGSPVTVCWTGRLRRQLKVRVLDGLGRPR